MRLRQQAALESEAVQLAASLGARMRANPVQMALPDGANPYLSFDYDAAGGDPPAAPADCHGSGGCDPAQLALFDLHETARTLRAAFPGGRIVVCRDSRAWNAALGTLDWECAGGAGAPVVAKLGWRIRGATADGAAEAVPVVAMVVAR
ncbi:type IV pilus modification protein PilV [Massilia sp. Se16.2.3]|uniref:type IV pilus modification protein PilV n=1 Tax=Massilia sp. Se16.2.3 TaxID=2709303 RepID=UPI001E3723B1|nr:type IV pilus modification protein PilV [Massilia sp. Se16.2.3]